MGVSCRSLNRNEKQYVILSAAEESRRHETPRSLGCARDDRGIMGEV
jgi:hypothetical protein